jgi:hypothetical protein
MRSFSNVSLALKCADEEELDFILYDRVKTWHEYYKILRCNVLSKEERCRKMYKRIGDMIDQDSIREIYEYEEKMLSLNDPFNEDEFESIMKCFINVLQYKKQYLVNKRNLKDEKSSNSV